MEVCPKCGGDLLYDKTSSTYLACYDCEWEADSERSERTFVTVIVAIFLMIGLAFFLIGRQTITVSDLSQQRAMDISSRVYGVCMERATDAVCKQVRDVVQKEIFAAGVEKEDEVVRRAKEIAKKVGK